MTRPRARLAIVVGIAVIVVVALVATVFGLGFSLIHLPPPATPSPAASVLLLGVALVNR